MAAALELIILPVMLIFASVILGVLDGFGSGVVLLIGMLLLVIVAGAIGLVRMEFTEEKDEGVELAPDESPHAP